MNYFRFSVLVVLLFGQYCRALNVDTSPVSNFFYLPPSDDYFHIYSLPVGQGDAMVMQCPGGELTILDMGSSNGKRGGKLWGKDEIKQFFGDSFDRIRNIIITHNDGDHYNLLPQVLSDNSFKENLKNIYISRTKNELHKSIKKWIGKFRLSSNLRIFNKGKKCGALKDPCGSIDVCSNEKMTINRRLKEISAKVLMANWGFMEDSDKSRRGERTDSKAKKYKNTNSPVLSLKIGKVKVLLSGDFEDYNDKKEEPSTTMVNYYTENVNKLKSDVYYVAHHGAALLANKQNILEAVNASAIVVSSNPFAIHGHPRCSVIERFVNTGNLLQLSVEKVTEKVGEKRARSEEDLFPMQLQNTYTCGYPKNEKKKPQKPKKVSNNKHAIYTTVPDEEKMNLVEFISDGYSWGFVNHYMDKIIKKVKTG